MSEHERQHDGPMVDGGIGAKYLDIERGTAITQFKGEYRWLSNFGDAMCWRAGKGTQR
jgi:hypothetical protein